MIYATQSKTINVAPPGALVNNASVNCLAVDRKGYDYAMVHVALGSTDAALTALKLQESDDDSTWSDVPGLDFSVSPATLPTSSSGNSVYSFDVDLRGRKRYLKPVVTVGSGTNGAYVTVQADLSRAEETPHDAASRGLAGALSA
ncbi:MAG TPA: hypothetical protein VG326_08530 [Tepidisphaeraceae bacterium]|jgi:hypothetical protein|nr:hypothetical protein [Tepidisphaeraceae bacterium]